MSSDPQQKDDILSKHCVLHIQVGLFGVCDEKLGTIRVGAIVCHWNHSSDIMLKIGMGGWGGGCDHIWDSKQQQQQNFLDELVTHFEMLAVLIFKFTAPYTCSSFACAWTVKGTVNVETKACFFSALQCYNQLKKFTGPKGESYWWFTMLHIVSKTQRCQLPGMNW